MRINVILQLVKVNFKDFFREPGSMFWSLVFPVAMAGILGLAFSQKNNVTTPLYCFGFENDNHLLVSFFKSNDTVKLYSYQERVNEVVVLIKSSQQEVLNKYRKGEIALYCYNDEGKIRFAMDPANEKAASLYYKLIEAIQLRDHQLVEKIDFAGSRYIDFLIPGLLALGIMNSCVWGISWFLLELRMKKLLRRMVASPLKKVEFLIAHTLTRLCLSIFESVVLLISAWLFFGIVISGSWIAFVFLYLAGVMCFGGIGILIASRTQNTTIGNGLINAVLLPMTLLCGVFFDYTNFPNWSVRFIELLPLSLLSDGMKNIFNNSAQFDSVAMPILGLSTLGVVFYTIGIKIFKWY